MDNLPIELVLHINKYLGFLDQVCLKSISVGFYDLIQVKQFIPNILIRSYSYSGGHMEPEYMIPLNTFYSVINKLRQQQRQLPNTNYDCIVIVPNKPINMTKVNTSDDFSFRIDGNMIYYGIKPSTYRTFITKCIEEAERNMLDEDVI